MSGQPLYQLDQVRRIVQKNKIILDIDSLSLPKGELTAIVGPNGAGKSTLLKILAFLEVPDQGRIRFQGRPIGPRDHTLLRRQITLVDQAPLLFHGTVFKNIAYGLKVRSVPRDQWSIRVDEALSMVDLDGFADRSVKGLSGGETQRVAIARALVFHPQVILLDEPTAGVDVARVDMVEALITELFVSTGVSILFSTHNLAQAYRLTDRIVHLAGGKRVANSMENLFSGQAGDGGLVQMKCGTILRIKTECTGLVRFSIPAAAVEIESSLVQDDKTNQFDGNITRMELRGAKVRLVLDGKLTLRAEMAADDFHLKGLKLGSRVTAIVPPDAIHLL